MAEQFNNQTPRQNTSKQDLLSLFYELVDSRFENDELYSRIGKVIAVDMENATCSVDVINGDNIDDVRLQQVKSSGLLIIPVVGSVVTLTFMSPTVAYVGNFSGVDSLAYQDGTNGGLIKIGALVSDLTRIVDNVNDLREAFNAWPVTPSDGGATV